MDRTQYTFYESFFKAAESIKSKAVRCDFYDMISRYALYGEEPNLEKLPDTVAMAYELIKPTLNASRRKAENGKRGGASKKGESKPKQAEANGKQTEANGKQEETANKKENEIENEIEIELENECYIAGDMRTSAEGKAFTGFWEAYPNKADREDVWNAWRELNPDAQTVRDILAGLAAWKKSGQWQDDGGRFIPYAAKWLRNRRWECPPAPSTRGQTVPQGASGVLGPAELDAIKQTLREEYP